MTSLLLDSVIVIDHFSRPRRALGRPIAHLDVDHLVRGGVVSILETVDLIAAAISDGRMTVSRSLSAMPRAPCAR